MTSCLFTVTKVEGNKVDAIGINDDKSVSETEIRVMTRLAWSVAKLNA